MVTVINPLGLKLVVVPAHRVLVLTLLLGVALAMTAVYAATFLVNITIKPESPQDVGDIIRIAEFCNSTEKCNWIIPLNGTEIPIPDLTFTYLGFREATYKRDNRLVTIKVAKNFTIVYPLHYVPILFLGQAIEVKYSPSPSVAEFVEREFNGKLYIALARTSTKQIRDVINSLIVDGNAEPLRQLIKAAEKVEVSVGQAKTVLTPSDVGDYVIIAYTNRTTQTDSGQYRELCILGLALLRVAEFKLAIEPARKTIYENETLSVKLTTLGVSELPRGLRYFLMLVKEDAYNVTLKLVSNGTIPGTKLYADTKVVVEGKAEPRRLVLLGKGLDKITVKDVEETLYAIFGADVLSITYSGITTEAVKTLPVVTEGLPAGKYLLIAMLLDPENKEIVAVNYTYIHILARAVAITPVPPPPPPVVKPPVKEYPELGKAVYKVENFVTVAPGVTVVGALTDIEMKSLDKALTVVIKKFTIPVVAGKPVPLKSVAIRQIERDKAPVSPNVEVVSDKVYIIETEPANVTFTKPIKVEIKLPETGTYYVAVWNETLGRWIPLPTEIVDGKAVAYVTAPGMIALVREVKPVEIKVGAISLEAPARVTVMQTFTLEVKLVDKTGKPLANELVKIYLDGKYIAYAITGPDGTAVIKLKLDRIGIYTITAEAQTIRTTATIVVSPVMS